MYEVQTDVMPLIEPYLLSAHVDWQIMNEQVDAIFDRYSEPWRHYHVPKHLGDMLTYLVENAVSLKHPRTTIWAALGHDEIYVPQAPKGVNEELSAQLSEARLERYIPTEQIKKVGAYIRATATHEWDGEDTDLAFLLDADMKILGSSAADFDEYNANIAKEFSFVDTKSYYQGRTEVLKSFFFKPRLFITDTAYEEFELQAKANLERTLDVMTAEHAKQL
jgi:predicted metal-dependent HD superfamily phosphohydrolase